MTWTWAFIIRVSASINPSNTFDSSMNFFHPQSCSFFQNRCNVSAEFTFNQLHRCRNLKKKKTHTSKPKLTNQPEYFDFFGSLFTTAIVNCAKWLQPVPQTKGSYMITTRQNQEQYTDWKIPNSLTYQTWKKLVMISNTEKQRKVIADITTLGIN